MKPNYFEKILIANRGEIAVRVIRACRELGIGSVAIFSEADREALHVRLADEAYFVGPSPSSQSYLNEENILLAAKKTGAEAIHPGYGFLSENTNFAQRVAEEGLVFIGPSTESIRLMGDKTASRKCMAQAGVTIVPGTNEELEPSALEKIAGELGYPVLLKAAAGGGGKGMRIVFAENEIQTAYQTAKSEAKSAFGDDRIFLEKYVENPRHIEFQILGDQHGNIVHLYERECSIQRRHQKVIEEAPSSVLDENLRKKMGEAAIAAARACGYYNAGTVEFIFDKSRNFYFLEMNTRLQVEHPVTEMVTGIDLVSEQIKIAAGEKLSFSQADIQLRGHAIESRIYAEDPENNFMPSTGKINYLREPAGPSVRNDSGFESGSDISIYYDPLISKLSVWGKNRIEAIQRMKRALYEYRIAGVSTSIPFCRFVMEHPKFVSGNFDTHFVPDELKKTAVVKFQKTDSEEAQVAMIAAVLYHNEKRKEQTALKPTQSDAVANQWKLLARKRQNR